MMCIGRFVAAILVVAFVAGGCTEAQLYTFTVVRTANGWSESAEAIQERIVPELEAEGGTLYGIWHPLELEEDAPFSGLSPNELILIVAWPASVLDGESSLVDSTMSAAAEVASTETRILEPVVLPHGPRASSGAGFYVIRTNRYRVEDVARVVQLSVSTA